MRYFFGSDVAEPDAEDIPSMATFRALGLDPDREPDALKVTHFTQQGGGLRRSFPAASLVQCRLVVSTTTQFRKGAAPMIVLASDGDSASIGVLWLLTLFTGLRRTFFGIFIFAPLQVWWLPFPSMERKGLFNRNEEGMNKHAS